MPSNGWRASLLALTERVSSHAVETEEPFGLDEGKSRAQQAA
jgi:hypothetical protein